MTADHAGHLDATTLAALLDGELEATARATAELHLAWCAACRREYLEAQSLARTNRPSRRVGWRPVAIAAAAALLVIVSGPPLRRALERGSIPAADRSSALRAASVDVVVPAPDAVVERDSTLRFAWHAPDSGSRFRLTLTDDRGETIWEVETGDTSVVLPDRIPLAAGHAYFWYVDALAPDGRSITSGAHRFSAR